MSRRTLPVRRLAVAALAPLALTTLAACSDGDPGSTAVDETSATSSTDEESPAEEPAEEPTAEAPEVAAGDSVETAAFLSRSER